jgi:hypothetical protein
VARYRLHAILFAIGLVVYGAVAADRIVTPSAAPQFVFQADAWLHGQASVDPPLVDADWAKVETVVLDDGSEVRGRRMITRPMFRTTGGAEIPIAKVKQSRGAVWYMSFPPLPTLLMLPSAAISGRAGNDVIPTLLIAALILPLALLVLRRLAAAGLSARSVPDDLWLVATLAFGSVLFFSAVQGKVWYTAHVVGVALALVYAWASIEAKHPIAAGLALGAAALTRTPMAFMFPLFVLEAWRMAGGLGAWRADRTALRRALVRPLLRFAAPVVAFAIAGMIYNVVRFGSPTEFGHTFLDVRQQAQIEQWGLANYHYLSRNLTVAFTLLPEFVGRAPWIQIGGHGLALWFTTPLVVYVLWPRDRNALHRSLWITVAFVALPSLLYQNSGWVQFGYRFSLDYMVFLVMLIAIGGRSLGRFGKALIVFAIAVNLFGAITFDRDWKYYRVGGNAYDVVMAH